MQALSKFSDLRCVVFSEKINRISKLQRFHDYGWWYSIEHITSQFLQILTNSKIDVNGCKLLGVDDGCWKEASDQQKIVRQLKKNSVDVVFICCFQHIIKGNFVENFNCCINIHPSLLPSYRGPEPIAWGLLDNCADFGVTFHLLDEGIDTGDIIGQYRVEPPFLKSSFLVERKIAKGIDELVNDVINRIAEDALNATPQSAGGFYLPAPTVVNRYIRAND